MASKDFNYQVALKEGLKSLEQGRFIGALGDSGDGERRKKEPASEKGQLRGVRGLPARDAIVEGGRAVADAPAEPEGPARFRERESGPALRPRPADQWAAPRAGS